MQLQTILYSEYEKGLPQSGNFILGQKKEGNIVVYQAFNKQIADYAIKHQKFGGNHYSFHRMTWIKPNFLWMMYRSGWALKENQERILAITMTLAGFETLLRQAIHTSFMPTLYETEENWKAALEKSEVRVQWDPDHNHLGEKLVRKAIQIGFKGEILKQWNTDFIVEMEDITAFVQEQRGNRDTLNEKFFVMREDIIEMNEDICKKIQIDKG